MLIPYAGQKVKTKSNGVKPRRPSRRTKYYEQYLARWNEYARGIRNPIVRFTYVEIKKQNVKLKDLEKKSGVSRYTIEGWFYNNYNPNWDLLEAVLNVLGYTCFPTRIEDHAAARQSGRTNSQSD